MKRFDQALNQLRTSLIVICSLGISLLLLMIPLYMKIIDNWNDNRDIYIKINRLGFEVRQWASLKEPELSIRRNGLLRKWNELSLDLALRGMQPLPSLSTLPAAQDLGSLLNERVKDLSKRNIESFTISLGLGVGTALMMLLTTGFFGFFLWRWIRFQKSFLATTEVNLENIRALLRFEPIRDVPSPRWAEEKRIQGTVRQVMDEVMFNRELLESVSAERHLDDTLETLLEVLKTIMPCDRLAVAFIDPFSNVVAEGYASLQGDVYLEQGFVKKLEETSLHHLAQSRKPRIIPDLKAYSDQNPHSESTRLILREGLLSSLTLPLFVSDHCVGFLFLSSRSRQAFTAEHEAKAHQVVQAIRFSIFHLYTLQQTLAESSRAFVALMEKKDNETSLHIQRMSYYSYFTAKALVRSPAYAHRLPPKTIREILWFAPLHDIGKIGIPDAILAKPGVLDPQERQVMETHVDLGAEVIAAINRSLKVFLEFSPYETGLEIIRGHHECWDGSGYPAGLKGEQIPLTARIAAVGDVFDALTSRRPYKEPWGWEQACNFLQTQSGKLFDPDVIDAFFTALPQIRSVYDRYGEAN